MTWKRDHGFLTRFSRLVNASLNGHIGRIVAAGLSLFHKLSSLPALPVLLRRRVSASGRAICFQGRPDPTSVGHFPAAHLRFSLPTRVRFGVSHRATARPLFSRRRSRCRADRERARGPSASRPQPRRATAPQPVLRRHKYRPQLPDARYSEGGRPPVRPQQEDGTPPPSRGQPVPYPPSPRAPQDSPLRPTQSPLGEGAGNLTPTDSRRTVCPARNPSPLTQSPSALRPHPPPHVPRGTRIRVEQQNGHRHYLTTNRYPRPDTSRWPSAPAAQTPTAVFLRTTAPLLTRPIPIRFLGQPIRPVAEIRTSRQTRRRNQAGDGSRTPRGQSTEPHLWSTELVASGVLAADSASWLGRVNQAVRQDSAGHHRVPSDRKPEARVVGLDPTLTNDPLEQSNLFLSFQRFPRSTTNAEVTTAAKTTARSPTEMAPNPGEFGIG